MRPRGEQVVIVRDSPGGTDEYGDPRAGTQVEWPAMTLYPPAPRKAGDSDHDGGVVVGLRIALPLHTDITRHDLVRIRGELWKVEGEIAEWRPAFGLDSRPGALDVNLTRAEVGTWLDS